MVEKKVAPLIFELDLASLLSWSRMRLRAKWGGLHWPFEYLTVVFPPYVLDRFVVCALSSPFLLSHKTYVLLLCTVEHTTFLLNTGVKICSLSPPGDYRNRADKTWKRSYVSILSANDDMRRSQHLVSPHHQRSGYAAQNAFS